MSRPAGRAFYARKFLNKPGWESNAFILAEIVKTDDKWMNSQLKIGDCDRSIQLSFRSDWGDKERPKSHANNLFKIDTLIEVLTNFREALIAEQTRLMALCEITSDEEDLEEAF